MTIYKKVDPEKLKFSEELLEKFGHEYCLERFMEARKKIRQGEFICHALDIPKMVEWFMSLRPNFIPHVKAMREWGRGYGGGDWMGMLGGREDYYTQRKRILDTIIEANKR
jgi:hypothetical protein